MRNFSKFYAPALLIGLLVVIGVSVNYHYENTEETATIEEQVLERAYHDVVAEEDIEVVQTTEENKTIKVFDKDYELIDSRVLKPEEMLDEDFSSLINQSSLIAEYNNSLIYRIK